VAATNHVTDVEPRRNKCYISGVSRVGGAGRAHERAARRRRDFSARGSDCPICKREFRGCPHSVVEALERLDRDVVEAAVADARRKDPGL
jgi:hypothetical protein